MLERRCTPRQRVCLEARITADLHSAPVSVRVRSISELGAEIIVAGESLPGEIVSFALSREGHKLRDAKVVWRRMGHFGLEFLPTAGVVTEGRSLGAFTPRWWSGNSTP